MRQPATAGTKRVRKEGPIQTLDRAQVRAKTDHIATVLLAEPTMISPVFVTGPGRQPRGVQAPPITLSKYMWIMFTVRPLLDTPSPEGICSFRTTYPTPGRLMLVLGATGCSAARDPARGRAL